ncbi:HAD family hydrolase, partial [Burkholderia pseudomallei]
MSARRQPRRPASPAARERAPERPRRRRARPQAGGPVWRFDLDNTLHHASHAIFPAINRAL